MENREQMRRAVGDAGIDRRDFLKGAAVSGAAALAAGALAGCAPQGDVEATADDLAATGADGGSEWGTFDENGKFTPSFLADPEPIPDDAIVEELDAEIVVVGFGLTGLSAAREAMEEGADVFVIEKGDTHHVHSHQFHAINAKAQKDAGYEVTDEEIDALVDRVMSDHRERVDRRMWSYLLHHCGEDFDWYLSACPHTIVNPNETVGETSLDAYALINNCTAGLAAIVGRYFDDVSEERMEAVRAGEPYVVPFNKPLNPNWNFADERYPMSAGVVQVEPTHAKVGDAVAKMVEEGARVNYACWARRLVQDDTGRVTGVIYADADDNLYKVNASKGVILATGDYGGNQQMIQYYMPRVLEDGEWLGWPDTDAKGNVTNIGEGLQMAHWVGARTDYCHAFPNDHYGGSLGCDPMLFVDGSGERFMNEDVTGEVLGEKVTRVNGRCIWQIFDDNYPDQISHMPVGHRCYWQVVDNFDDIPMGLFLDPIGMITRSEVEMMTPCICDTVEELAAAMEVPADTLKATIDRYNELCEKGVDEDFGKRADRMAPVKQPPFYAAKMPTLGYQTFYGSVCCDYNMHAVDMDNRPIPGLYVGGTIMGSRFWHIYPNTTMGMNHAGALCYGRLAAKNAVAGI